MAIMNIKDTFKQGEATLEELVVELLNPSKNWYWGPGWGFPSFYSKNGGTSIGENQELLGQRVGEYIAFTILRPKSEEERTEDHPYWLDFGGVYKDGELKVYECDGNWVDIDGDDYHNGGVNFPFKKEYLDDLKKRIKDYLDGVN